MVCVKLSINHAGNECPYNAVKANNCGKSRIKPYLCNIILKGCLALGSKTNCFYQTERQAEIKPIV
jgi:hypothetical protein